MTVTFTTSDLSPIYLSSSYLCYPPSNDRPPRLAGNALNKVHFHDWSAVEAPKPAAEAPKAAAPAPAAEAPKTDV